MSVNEDDVTEIQDVENGNDDDLQIIIFQASKYSIIQDCFQNENDTFEKLNKKAKSNSHLSSTSNIKNLKSNKNIQGIIKNNFECLSDLKTKKLNAKKNFKTSKNTLKPTLNNESSFTERSITSVTSLKQNIFKTIDQNAIKNSPKNSFLFVNIQN